jgi:hypothetical protein
VLLLMVVTAIVSFLMCISFSQASTTQRTL